MRANLWSMPKRCLAAILALVLAISFVPLAPKTALAQEEGAFTSQEVADTFPGSADGSAENPYLISTENDLRAFAESVNGYKVEDGAYVENGEPNDYSGKIVKLANDIELTEAFTPIGIGTIASTSSTTNIDAVPFSGTFDGSGHNISNLFITTTSNPVYGTSLQQTGGKHKAGCFNALFGAIKNASIQNVIVEYSENSETVYYAAGLVAVVKSGENKIEKCGVRSDFETEKTAPLTYGNYGGIVGAYCDTASTSDSLTIVDSYHQGKLKAPTGVGGIVGNLAATSGSLKIERCYQSGEVETTNTSTSAENFYGAIVGNGSTTTTISSCVTDTCITDGVARFKSNNSSKTTVEDNCVTVSDDVWNSEAVKAALGEAFVYSDDASTPPSLDFSKFAVNTYEVNFEAGADDVVGTLPTLGKQAGGAEVEIPVSTLTRRGYTFDGWKSDIADDPTPSYNAGDKFTMPEAAVTFTAQWKANEVSKTFTTEEELRDFAAQVNNGALDTYGQVFALDADIALTKDWTPIGTSGHEFQGVFLGQDHVISGMKVTDDTSAINTDTSYNAAGFFGEVNGATIQDLGVEGSVDTTQVRYNGGLIGLASGTMVSPKYSSSVKNCFARVDVSGQGFVGGLIGQVAHSTMENCYASGTVTILEDGGLAVGGLVGHFLTLKVLADDAAVVTNCYANVEVIPYSSTAQKGGLFGSVSESLCNVSQGETWDRVVNSYTTTSDIPVYYTYSGNYSTDSVSASPCNSDVYKKAAADLTATLMGSAYKSDSAVMVNWINGGLPVLSWEVVSNTAAITSVSLDTTAYTYDGTAKTPGVTVKTGDYELISNATESNEDVKITYPSGRTNVGTYIVTVQGQGYYTGELTTSFTINAKNISDTTIVNIADQTYTGSAIEPAVTLKDGSNTLVEGSDYTVSYSDNTNVGTAKVTVTGKGNYTGSTTSTFAIAAKSIESATVSSIADQTYTGSAVQPSVSVSLDGVALKAGFDYAVSYKDNIKAGTASVVITGLGNYTGTKTANFSIVAAPTATPTATTANIGGIDYKVGSDGGVIVTGTQATGSVTIPATVKIGGKSLKVTVIADKAFKGKKITKVTIGNNVTSIGASAFQNCKSLKTVTIGKKVKTIGASAFQGCSKLTKITIPASVKSIGKKAFCKCTKLTKVVIGNNVTSIGASAFQNCKSLKTVTIGKKVKTIGASAFQGCSKLTKITIPASVKSIGKKAFYKCTKLKKVTIKTTKLTKAKVGASAFKGINKKATFKVPAKKLKAYKKVLVKSKGVTSKMKIKK